MHASMGCVRMSGSLELHLSSTRHWELTHSTNRALELVSGILHDGLVTACMYVMTKHRGKREITW
jgi:hypothetical protein